jgi:phosphoesterase RecJ-like protein
MQKLLEKIAAAKRVVLVSHIHPDGDAVGSLIAMALGLEQLGKEVYAVLADGVPSSFQFLSAHVAVETVLPPLSVAEPAMCIALDLADAARTGFKDHIDEYGRAEMLGFIDHHPFGDLQKKTPAYYHSLATSSCAELVYHVLTALGVRFTPPLATALLTGMYTDTGGFQYDNTSTDTMEIGAELMRRGARLRTIVDHTNQQKSIANLRLLGLALERLTVTRHGQCAVSVISHDDILATKATPEDVGGIINQLNVLPGPKVTLLLTEIEPGVIRGSLRSNDHPDRKPLNVTPLAKLLGGGGHARASGFMLHGTINIDKTAATQWKVT